MVTFITLVISASNKDFLSLFLKDGQDLLSSKDDLDMMFGKKKDKTRANTLKDRNKTTNKIKNKTSLNFDLSAYFQYPQLIGFIRNEKNQYLFGFALMFAGLYLLFSFTSYFFSWKVDQDKIPKWTTLGSEAFDEINQKAANNTGTAGAKISHFFIHKLTGITAYFLPIALILAGVKLSFKKEIFPFLRALKVLAFYAVIGSSILSLVFPDAPLNPGGTFGHQLNIWLIFTVGKTGLIILLFLSVIISLFLFFNVRLDELLQKLKFNGEFKTEDASENVITEQELHQEISHGTSHTVNPVVRNEIQEELKQNDNAVIDSDASFTETSPPISPEGIKLTPELSPENNSNADGNTEVDADNSPKDPLQEWAIEKSSGVNPSKGIDNNFTVNDTKDGQKEEVQFEVEAPVQEETTDRVLPNSSENYDPTLDLSSYKYPTIELLKNYEVGNSDAVDSATLEKNKDNIVNTLKNYKIEIASIKASIGPTVTLYEIIPAPGVRISKIKNLEDDIALSLAALGIRIIAPIPGRGTIGIEVPNPNPDVVAMRTVIASKAFAETKMDLPIALGKTISNETLVVDLAKMPHLLMAGATGQGKSVGLNCILVSLLYKKHPSQLKFVLVDPKKVELTLFNKIERHYLAKLPDSEEAIITETTKVVNTLNSLCMEMDQRYELLKEAHCRNLKEYNAKFIDRRLNPEKGHRFLPFIVLVVDEFADLIMTAGKEVETPIARLAQLARAIGIHLIIATQRPSVNIITGTIKANFPARIAFRVTSKIDSRTILDAGGADQLIGRGDMLLTTGNDLIRVQCAFVDTPEVESITEFIGDQRGYPDAFLLPEVEDVGDSSATGNPDILDRDALFVEAAKVVVMHQQGSASLLQRKLKLGYNRAGRIVDQLEEAGIIGPFEGSKARQVLISDEASLEQYLNYNEADK